MPPPSARMRTSPGLRTFPALPALASLAACALLAAPAPAAIIWDESMNGELSDDYLAPTILIPSAGDNLLFASIGENPDGTLERDFVTLRIPAGLWLEAITLETYSGPDSIAFVGLRIGPTLTVAPDATRPEDLDGYALFGTGGSSPLGDDILDDISRAQLPARFTTPLPAGDYAFWFQQLNGLTEFGLNFVVVVPAPGPAGLLLASGLLAMRRKRRTH